MIDERYKKVARVIIKAGSLPFPINDTLVHLLKILIDESELDFIMAFKRKASQTMEELKRSSKMTESDILKFVKSEREIFRICIVSWRPSCIS